MISTALTILAALALTGALAVEIALRLAGIGGFPLFARDPASVYRMASSQQGRFRRKARWHFDRFGMRTHMTIADLSGQIVLLGDSVVEGGFHLDQDETLATRVACQTGRPVYPVACHGWALANELGALTALPGWDKAAALVWVVNTGDFDTIGRGESELSFPTRRPVWLTLWLLRRHIYRADPWWWPWGARVPKVGPRRPEVRAEALARFADIAPRIAGPIVIVAHAQRGQSIAQEPFFGELAAVRPGIRTIAPCDAAAWDRACYLDDIHPNARGAAIMADAIVASLPPREEP